MYINKYILNKYLIIYIYLFKGGGVEEERES